MKECDNSEIHISRNFLLSICLLIMLDALLLGPSLHFYTSQHFTTLHPTTLHYTCQHFTSSHLHFTTLSFGLTHLQFSHLQTYFQNNEPVHCPKEHLTISLHFTFYYFFLLILSTLHFVIHIYNSLPFTSLHFSLFIAFTSPHWFLLS
jgi:hypothetical protein